MLINWGGHRMGRGRRQRPFLQLLICYFGSMIRKFTKGVFNMSLQKSLFLMLIITAVLGLSCAKKEGISTPEKISNKTLTQVISGEEALKVIDKLHGLSVAPQKNAIVEYGDDPKDLLYISWYEEQDQAREAFITMISKMMKAEKGPFTHIRALPDYGEKVFMSIGMGAIHYIYHSSHYILWLQTYQDIGRELPDELLSLYPI